MLNRNHPHINCGGEPFTLLQITKHYSVRSNPMKLSHSSLCSNDSYKFAHIHFQWPHVTCIVYKVSELKFGHHKINYISDNNSKMNSSKEWNFQIEFGKWTETLFPYELYSKNTICNSWVLNIILENSWFSI